MSLHVALATVAMSRRVLNMALGIAPIQPAHKRQQCTSDLLKIEQEELLHGYSLRRECREEWVGEGDKEVLSSHS